MKPSQIFEVMDVVRRARSFDRPLNALLSGPPGVGKSQIVQQWCKAKGLPFIDLRAAYLESPDLIGFPSIEVKSGRSITVHNIPEFWPLENEAPEGVLLLEEPNRGTTAVLNTFMQLLTDRKVHKYTLPEKWIIVGCINEGAEYDVNVMDTALMNRFVKFDIKYDKESFVDYMKKANFEPIVQMFVESGTWVFTPPDQVGNNPDVKYTSPRSIEQLDTVLKCELPDELELLTYESILGKAMGMTFHQFKNNERPVTYLELVSDSLKALDRLRKFADPSNYKNGHISVTIKDIVDTNIISDELLAKVLLTLPADQSVSLLDTLSRKRGESEELTLRIVTNFPEVKKYLRDVLKLSKKKKES